MSASDLVNSECARELAEFFARWSELEPAQQQIFLRIIEKGIVDPDKAIRCLAPVAGIVLEPVLAECAEELLESDGADVPPHPWPNSPHFLNRRFRDRS